MGTVVSKTGCHHQRTNHQRRCLTVAIAAKSTSDAYKTTPFPPDPNSQQSTVSTVERDVLDAGGTAIAITADVRNVRDIEHHRRQSAYLFAILQGQDRICHGKGWNVQPRVWRSALRGKGDVKCRSRASGPPRHVW